MIKIPALLLLFLLSFLSVFGQSKMPRWHILTEAEIKVEKAKFQCVHRNTYSAVQRLKFYPFNKAAQVKLVSFESYGRNVQIPIDSTERVAASKIRYWEYPFENNKIDTSQFIKTMLLDKLQINKLTDILYNIGERAPNKFPDPGSKCYQPRNAVIFIDAKGKIFAYIEICFECEKIETHPKKMNIGGLCADKLNLLKRYFAAQGIKYGTDEAYTHSFSSIRSQ